MTLSAIRHKARTYPHPMRHLFSGLPVLVKSACGTEDEDRRNLVDLWVNVTCEDCLKYMPRNQYGIDHSHFYQP